MGGHTAAFAHARGIVAPIELVVSDSGHRLGVMKKSWTDDYPTHFRFCGSKLVRHLSGLCVVRYP